MKSQMIILKRKEVEVFLKKGYCLTTSIEIALHKHDWYTNGFGFEYKVFKETIHVWIC